MDLACTCKQALYPIVAVLGGLESAWRVFATLQGPWLAASLVHNMATTVMTTVEAMKPQPKPTDRMFALNVVFAHLEHSSLAY